MSIRFKPWSVPAACLLAGVLAGGVEAELRVRPLPIDEASPRTRRAIERRLQMPHDLRAPGVSPRVPRELEDILRPPGDLPDGAQAAATEPRVFRLAVFRVDFLRDSHGDLTTGNGRFDLRRNTDVPVDPPPHDKAFFEAHGRALSRYYAAQSYDRFQIEVTVLPPGPEDAFHLEDTGKYGPWEISQDIDVIENAEEFVRDAIGAVAATNTVVFSDYDGFVVVHAGADFQGDVDNNTPEDLPSFTLALAEPIVTPTGEVATVLVLPETVSQDGLLGALNGVFAHEFGHILELPDLYNICTGFPQVGYWSLMDSGENIAAIVEDRELGIEFEARGIFPTSLDPWSKLQVFGDAMQVVPVAESWEGQLEGTEISPVVPLVPVDAFEYFLVENRALDLDGNGFPWVVPDSLTGVFLGPADDPDLPGEDGDREWDAVLPGGGVFLWHIDDRVVLAALSGRGFEGIPEAPPCARSAVNLGVSYRGVAMEEADGIWDLGIPGRAFLGRPEDAFYDPNNTRFGPGTVPASDTNLGAYTGLTIDIEGAPDRFMRVSIRNELNREGWPVVLAESSTPSSTLPLDLNGDGKQEFLFAFRDEVDDAPPQNAIAAVAADGVPYPDSTTGFAIVNQRLGRPLVTDRDSPGVTDPMVATTTTGGLLLAWGSEGDGDEGPLLSWNEEAVATSPAFFAPRMFACAGRGSFLVFRDGELLFRTESVLAPSAGAAAGPAVVRIPTDDAGDIPFFGFGFDGGVLEVFPLEPGVAPRGARFSSNVRHLLAGPVLGSERPLLVAVTADSVFVVDHLAAVQTAWRLPDGESPARPPALGDIDGDGREELVLGTVAGTVLAYNGDGSIAQGWPVRVSNGRVRDLKIADVDGDGDLDVLVLDVAGLFHGFTGDGRSLESYPRSLGPFTVTDAWLTDLDGDGSLTWVAAAAEGALVSLRFPGAVARSGDWRGPRGGRTGDGASGFRAPARPDPERPELGPGRLIVFPNPSRGRDVEIRFTLESGETAEVQLTDLRGEGLEDPDLDFRGGPRAGENTVLWRVGSTAPGLYLCRVQRRGPAGERTDLVKIAIVR